MDRSKIRTKIFPFSIAERQHPWIEVPVRIRSKHALTYTPAALESRCDGFLYRSRGERKATSFARYRITILEGRFPVGLGLLVTRFTESRPRDYTRIPGYIEVPLSFAID